MKIVIITKDSMILNVYSNENAELEVVELDLSSPGEAVKLPKKGWTDVELCNIDVIVNRKFVDHVFDDEGRNEELEEWKLKLKKKK